MYILKFVSWSKLLLKFSFKFIDEASDESPLPTCKVDVNDYKKGEYLMYVGGGLNPKATVELLSLDPETHPVPSCFKDYWGDAHVLARFPYYLNDGAGALMWPGNGIIIYM